MDHIKSDFWIYDPLFSYEYSEILIEGICSIPKSKAKRNLDSIEKLLVESEVFEYIEFSESSISEFYFKFILNPSNCGLIEEARNNYNLVKKYNFLPDIYNLIGESKLELNSFKLLASSLFPKNNEKISNDLIEDLKFFNREPSEIDLFFEKEKKEIQELRGI